MDFVRSYFGTNEPLTSWTSSPHFLFPDQHWSEVHLYWSNFLRNPYFSSYFVLRAQIIKWIETLKVKVNLRITLINLRSFNLFLLFIFQLHIFFFLYHFSSFFIPLCFCVFMPWLDCYKNFQHQWLAWFGH